MNVNHERTEALMELRFRDGASVYQADGWWWRCGQSADGPFATRIRAENDLLEWAGFEPRPAMVAVPTVPDTPASLMRRAAELLEAQAAGYVEDAGAPDIPEDEVERLEDAAARLEEVARELVDFADEVEDLEEEAP